MIPNLVKCGIGVANNSPKQQRTEDVEGEYTRWREVLGTLPQDLQLKVLNLIGHRPIKPKFLYDSILNFCAIDSHFRLTCEQHKDTVWQAALESQKWLPSWNTGLENKRLFQMLLQMNTAREHAQIDSLLGMDNETESTTGSKFELSKHLDIRLLPPNLTTINACTFYGCEALDITHFPLTLRTIGLGAFEKCYRLRSPALPDSLTAIDESAFNLCLSLNWTLFPRELRTIGRGAFEGCANLELNGEDAIPLGVKHIKAWTFSGCKSLNLKRLPRCLEEIHLHAFFNCTSLSLEEEDAIPLTLTKVHQRAFFGCKNLSTLAKQELLRREPSLVFDV